MRSYNQFRQYMKEHLSLYIFVSVLFLMGVIFGALLVNALTLEQKQDMLRYLHSFFNTLNQNAESSKAESVKQAFALHSKWFLLIWVLGFTVIGIPLILILNFLKGILIGFTVGYFVGQLSWNGMLFALLSVAPQNLLIIPMFIVLSVSAVAFSLYLLKNRFLKRRGSLSQPFMTYTLIAFSFIALLFAVALFEAYITPHLLKWASPLLLTALN